MDFLKLIRSFGDLLFEVLSWVIYYPRTMWLVLRHPLRMVDYSNHEQRDSEEEQYTDTLAPPLLLLLTILVVHAGAIGMGRADEIPIADSTVRSVVNADQNLVILRSFLFGLLPLFAAAHYVRSRKLPLDRKYLRPVFYGECYLAAAYVLFVSLALIVARAGDGKLAYGGAALAVGATVWYWIIQSMQFRRAMKVPWPRAIAGAIWVYAQALFALAAIGFWLVEGFK